MPGIAKATRCLFVSFFFFLLILSLYAYVHSVDLIVLIFLDYFHLEDNGVLPAKMMAWTTAATAAAMAVASMASTPTAMAIMTSAADHQKICWQPPPPTVVTLPHHNQRD